jgi:hypothetical protein
MLPYYPGLRFKQGEYFALGKLPRDMRRHIEPRFIVPPPKDFDPELERVPTLGEIAHLTGDRIGKHWPLHRAFLDTRFIAADLGDDGLRTLYRLAQGRNSNIVPVATIKDLRNPLFRQIQCRQIPKLGIVVGYEEADPEALSQGLAAAGITASDCVLFIDFTGAPLEPEIAAGSIAGIFDMLYEVGPWHRMVFQGSNFPAKNTADPGKTKLIPRDEWAVFHAAINECGVPPDQLGYGDFAADAAEMSFQRRKGGGRAIRHLRYTTKTHTVIVRGVKEGTDANVMRDVCQRILASEHYAGQSFSEADDRIFRVAKGMDGPGTASMWREWNTTHHVTRVIRDLGAMAGLEFADGRVTVEPDQPSFFDAIEEMAQ